MQKKNTVKVKIDGNIRQVVLRDHQRVKVGKLLVFRDAKPYTEWELGIVEAVSNDGTILITLK